MADLTTTDAVRSLLGIDSVEADDLIALCISGASEWFAGEVGGPITATTYNEVRDGSGRTSLVLEHSPVLSVTGVKVDGVEIPARSSVTGAGWVLDGDAIRLIDYTFSRGVQNVEVAYSAGYASVPADVERAVAIVAAMRFREKDRLGQAYKVVGGETIDFRFTGDPGFAFVRDIINATRARMLRAG